MFGTSPSVAAIKAAKIFKKEGIKSIIELGAGQGRDTLFFAESGFHVQALDYSKNAINNILDQAKSKGLDKFINTKYCDLRKPLPFKNATAEGCFSHMLYCMAFTVKELEYLSKEILRILKFGGINFYTVRHTGDADYKSGIYRGEDLYESNGFIVHFFSKKKILQLSTDFEILNIDNFEEGQFPRKLFQVVLRK